MGDSSRSLTVAVRKRKRVLPVIPLFTIHSSLLTRFHTVAIPFSRPHHITCAGVTVRYPPDCLRSVMSKLRTRLVYVRHTMNAYSAVAVIDPINAATRAAPAPATND